ncbi:hypothetical protein [Neobacillus soli]|uniref:hypothetical protein n=1 Tax=Neobacillus soli TaxID=220688 RepID=UPI001471DD2B|nr:hypothetical protein [Neobacillus soli]
MKIAFLSCTKSKAYQRCSASEMYQKSTCLKKLSNALSNKVMMSGMFYLQSTD